MATAVAMPVAFAALISFALGGESSVRATIAVVDLDGGPAGRAFVEQALGDPRVTSMVDVAEASDPNEARRLADRGSVDATVVIPEGTTAELARGAAAPPGGGDGTPLVEVVTGNRPSLGVGLVELVADLYEVQARATSIAQVHGGALPDLPDLDLKPVAIGGRALDPATHYGPAIGLLFVMLTFGSAVERQVLDRRSGVGDRLASTTSSPTAVLAGRSLAALAVGCGSLAVTALAMQLVFGRGWGPPASVAAVAVTSGLAMAGIAAIVAPVVRTPGQVQTAVTAIGFAMALASGTFSPPGTASRPHFALLAPTTHALDGFALTTTEDAGLATLAPILGTLVAMAAIGFGVAAVLSHRRAP